ncbi:MAG: hypothetical protein KIS78_30670, partial [Labilithrix sp.]|nr:hypothetical protein [Labilithrix sp.]
GGLMAEAVGRQDHSPEVTGAPADRRLAAEIANLADGRVAPSPTEVLARTLRPAPELAVTWPYALVAAAALVVVDLVLRRLGAPRRARGAPLRVEHLPRAPSARSAA